MLKKILIANRGEIACRIVRTARKLGVATVAVYSDADAKALHVEQADEAVHIGPSPATDSYLRGDKIIAAAKATAAEGIHPGYGFLSENADFADAVTKAGLKFIGPTAAAMRALGGKAAAKEIAIKAGVPVVPGYQGEKQDAKSLSVEAKKIGYPVMIKAVAGGGGRGMRLVPSEAELPELLASAQREAESAFGNAHVLIEKVVERPRHIEVQVFGDAHGQVVHMFERDCTLQRRNQKVIEEAPAPGMSEALREKMCAAAVKLAKSVGYEGAGTVEFLVEGSSLVAPSVAHTQPAQLGPDAKWYFIEMNTRLQVEHPVTEEITGLDLVEWQLRVASGEKLPLAQSAIKMSGHAIEVRLCAEDPAKGFLPSVGRIIGYGMPRHDLARTETGVKEGSEISPYYDSMIAKLIASAGNRQEATAKLARSLERTHVLGPRTNMNFLHALISHPNFRSGDMDTGLIGRDLDSLTRSDTTETRVAETIGLWLDWRNIDRHNGVGEPWRTHDGFQLGESRTQDLLVVVNGESSRAKVKWSPGRRLAVEFGQGRAELDLDKGTALLAGVWGEYKHYQGSFFHQPRGCLSQIEIAFPTYDASAIDDGATGDVVRAPINGKVARVFVAEGDVVEKGQRIAVVEAMKMEHVLTAGRAGTIAKVAVKEGAQVNQGALLVALVEV